MFRKMLISAVAGFAMLAMFPNAALAQTADAQFRADIERLLEVTGSAKLGAQMARLVADSVMSGLKQSRPDIPDRAFTIVKEVLDEEFSNMYAAPDGILGDMVDLYAKHFTHDDVLGLLELYSSPVGQKAVSVLPLL